MTLLYLAAPWLLYCLCIGVLWRNSVRRHRQWQAEQQAARWHDLHGAVWADLTALEAMQRDPAWLSKDSLS